MKNYDIYFEMYGRKMKTTILAENEEKAKEAVLNKIIFHKVQVSKDDFNDIIDLMDGIIDNLKNIKK